MRHQPRFSLYMASFLGTKCDEPLYFFLYLSGWWFGTWILFSHILGIIIPIDFPIFQRGGPTTNQLWWVSPLFSTKGHLAEAAPQVPDPSGNARNFHISAIPLTQARWEKSHSNTPKKDRNMVKYPTKFWITFYSLFGGLFWMLKEYHDRFHQIVVHIQSNW